MAGLCVVTFFMSGGARINAIAMYSYASVLFIAFPMIYVGIDKVTPSTSLASLIIMSTLLFFMQIVLYVVAFGNEGGSIVLARANVSVLGGVTFVTSGLWLTVGIVHSVGQLQLLFAFVTISGLCVLSFLVKSTTHSRILIYLSAFLCIVYIAIGSGEFGRLLRATVVLALPVAISIVTNKYGPKIILASCTPPLLIILATMRLGFLGDLRGSSASNVEGISSVLAPLLSGAKILEQYMEGSLVPSGGSSFYATAFVWVPHTLWPGKPVGFGREIVPVTQPSLVNVVGYSDAANHLAEFIWNFGILGTILGGVVVVYLLMRFDRFLAVKAISSPIRVPLFLLIVAVVSSIPNYVWGGSFNWFSRLLPIVGPLLMLMILLRLHRGRPKIGQLD